MIGSNREYSSILGREGSPEVKAEGRERAAMSE